MIWWNRSGRVPERTPKSPDAPKFIPYWILQKEPVLRDVTQASCGRVSGWRGFYFGRDTNAQV